MILAPLAFLILEDFIDCPNSTTSFCKASLNGLHYNVILDEVSFLELDLPTFLLIATTYFPKPLRKEAM